MRYSLPQYERIKAMKYLVVSLLFLSSFAFADVHITPADIYITPPSNYDNGNVLLESDISHYLICVAVTFKDECKSEIEITGNIIEIDSLPASTHHIKALTVMNNGTMGIYGEPFTESFRKPNPPGLRHRGNSRRGF